MQYEYKTQGVCSARILFEVENGIVNNIRFIGGCSGNTQGVASLANGRPVDEVISLLSGIRCGSKNTSCPDQLACALQQAKNA
jgi:uncharacterized protein (TIGR03905 family)